MLGVAGGEHVKSNGNFKNQNPNPANRLYASTIHLAHHRFVIPAKAGIQPVAKGDQTTAANP